VTELSEFLLFVAPKVFFERNSGHPLIVLTFVTVIYIRIFHYFRVHIVLNSFYSLFHSLLFVGSFHVVQTNPIMTSELEERYQDLCKSYNVQGCLLLTAEGAVIKTNLVPIQSKLSHCGFLNSNFDLKARMLHEDE
jgi:hypothetical protein